MFLQKQVNVFAFPRCHSRCSPADKWYNCAINDKRMKLGTNVEHMKRNIFRYRAISDWSRDQYGGCILKRAWSSP